MKINKSLDIDLNIISPQRNIQIHEGDIDSIDIVLAVSADDVSLDLTGLTIKYDATINNYLAEQDADGSVVENKIVIPVTENMTAMPGLLLTDVRMIQEDEILFTRTIRATVERAVVNGSVYIDFSKITIIQRMNALEEQMTYIEELVDGLDTSKQITSNRRPPQTAPATVNVDFFRAGDTWIYQGFNIVYKLVEAEYNYQPDPEVPAVHKLTWQPLNEYFSFGTSEPPTRAVYTPIEYVIGDLTFNALPVPEYFKGDTYAQLVSGEIQTLSVLTNAAEVSSGQYTYSWHENGGGDDDNKMDLAPINPTAQKIEAMPSGQWYLISNLNKAFLTLGEGSSPTAFYDAAMVDYLLLKKQKKVYFERPKGLWVDSSTPPTHEDGSQYEADDLFIYYNILFKYDGFRNIYNYGKINKYLRVGNCHYALASSPASFMPPTEETATYINTYDIGDCLCVYSSATGNELGVLQRTFKCKSVLLQGTSNRYYYRYSWEEQPLSVYSKSEINSMIGDIGSAIDTLNGNIDTLNTNLSEV